VCGSVLSGGRTPEICKAQRELAEQYYFNSNKEGNSISSQKKKSQSSTNCFSEGENEVRWVLLGLSSYSLG